MEGFTIIDGISLGVILLSAILAYSRGFVRELLAIAGWAAAAVVAYMFAPQAVPLAREIPYLNTLIEGCEPATITAFALVFAVALVIVSIFTPVFAGVVQRSALGGIDQGLGFLFGIARGALLVIIAIIVYDRAVVDDTLPMVDNSRTAMIVDQMSGPIDEAIPSNAPGWIVSTYENLIADCGLPSGSASGTGGTGNGN
ncbi:MAG: CvpA family protein [Paracoccaceae bacterium]